MTSLILDFMLVSEIIKGRSLESLVGQLVGAIAVKAVILVLGALGDVVVGGCLRRRRRGAPCRRQLDAYPLAPLPVM